MEVVLQILEEKYPVGLEVDQEAEVATVATNMVHKDAKTDNEVAEEEVQAPDLEAQLLQSQTRVRELEAALAEARAELRTKNQLLEKMQQRADSEAETTASEDEKEVEVHKKTPIATCTAKLSGDQNNNKSTTTCKGTGKGKGKGAKGCSVPAVPLPPVATTTSLPSAQAPKGAGKGVSGKGAVAPPVGSGKIGGAKGKGKGGAKGGASSLVKTPEPPEGFVGRGIHVQPVRDDENLDQTIFKHSKKKLSSVRQLKHRDKITASFFTNKAAGCKKSAASTSTGASGSTKKQAAKKPEKLASSDRCNAVGIFQRGRNVTIADLKAILASTDAVPDKKSVEDLATVLQEVYPTSEEQTQLKKFHGMPEEAQCQVSAAERFLVELLEIGDFEEKARILITKVELPENVSRLASGLEELEGTISGIKKSEALAETFTTLVELGNYVNQGTTRGAQVGFTAESLPKFAQLTGTTEKGHTLLHAAAAELEDSDTVAQVVEVLGGCDKATKTIGDLDSFDREAKQLALQARKYGDETLRERVKELACKVESAKNAAASLLVYFSATKNADGKDTTAPALLLLLRNFGEALGDAANDNKRRAEQQAKQKRREEEQQRRQEARRAKRSALVA